MCLTGAALRSVLVVLLLAYSCGKRRCNYKEILDSYRDVIFVELQNLNLTDSLNTTKERDHCPAGKGRRILGSIYGMTQHLRCQMGGQQQWDLEKPVESMEHLIIRNCNLEYLGKRASCSARQKTQGKKRRRIKVIRVIKAITTCWQKLQSIYSVLSKTKDK
ncbi:hypothetical protein LDENG_00225690 [Lucifuga dentata]|nr:hypothetical protein LDENG_00225690 [Lucifuga dentata]